MNNEQTLSETMAALDRRIEATPEAPRPISGTAPAERKIDARTQMPRRYRSEWMPPTDPTWTANFAKVMQKCELGGIVALIGTRGTGKTRIAAEAMRNLAPEKSSYTTAMGLFLRIRASYGKAAKETESDIVKEMATEQLLVIDEVQERGNTAWEDRLLTHILDKRYGAMMPTIIIANLTETALIECLGDSIVSRISENGGILEMKGKSHREAA